jgi:hypothetical protein
MKKQKSRILVVIAKRASLAPPARAGEPDEAIPWQFMQFPSKGEIASLAMTDKLVVCLIRHAYIRKEEP